MRILISFLSLFIFLSCNNTDAVVKDTQSKEESKPIQLTAASKKKVVNELQKLKSAIDSKDKNQMANYFEFPVTPSYYMDESLLQNGKLTKQIFLDHFEEIYSQLSFDLLPACMNRLDIDSLRYNDEIANLTVPSVDPCESYYQANLSHDTISLEIGSSSNPDYKLKKDEEDSVFDGCEGIIRWLFCFDGQKLLLIGYVAAG